MGCCQSGATGSGEIRSEIVSYEKRYEKENIFVDNFYIESVERYNVKYKPKKQSSNNANINGGSGASGGARTGQ